MNELWQEQEEQAAAGNGAAAAGATGGQEEPASSSGRAAAAVEEGMADLDYEAGEMSQEEMQVLGSSRALVAAAEATLKAFSQALLKGRYKHAQKPTAFRTSCSALRVYGNGLSTSE